MEKVSILCQPVYDTDFHFNLFSCVHTIELMLFLVKEDLTLKSPSLGQLEMYAII